MGAKSEVGGLISADRKASLLSCLQYPHLLKVVYNGFSPRRCQVAIECDAGPKPIVTRVTPGLSRRCQHGFWLRGVQP
jgi:hypothetical protein